jgi:mono/diheme cytochrome c family protein/rhodanese-related sulfurtransferase
MALTLPRFFSYCLFLLISGALLNSCQSFKKEQPFLLGQGTGINSAALLINDIEAGIKFYEDSLGFNIRGKAKEGVFEGTLTASIAFGDMSSFELMSINDTLNKSLVPGFISDYLARNEGVRLFSLSSSSVDSTYSALTSMGLQPDSIQSYRRTASEPNGWSRDDGGVQRSSLDFDAENPPVHLPRFIENIGLDYSAMNKEWNTYYIYRRMYNKHPNGVVGMSAIRVAVNDLKLASGEYEKMGLKVVEESDTMIKYSLFRHQELHLLSSQNDPSVNQFLKKHGEGVLAIQFDVENLDSTYQFFEKELPSAALKKTSDRLTIAAEYAFGVQLEFVQEPEAQKLLVRKLTPKEKLDPLAVQYAAGLYTKYCALCHGENREGYAADYAPSLKSHSLLATSKNTNFMRYTIQFGRANSAMAGYLDTQGGPMEYIEIELLLQWLYETAEVDEPKKLSREPILGDIEQGATLYAQKCAVCHGEKGEGVTAPALANPMLLATATDHFLRYAISEGRDGTPMMAFKDQLSEEEIDDLTAFLRSRASGWDIPKPDTVAIPTPDEYVLNPASESPVFNLREGMFVSSEQVNQALQDSLKMIILDARSEVAWRQMHIPGAIPVPYYEEPENFVNDIPNDGTQIVIYCACPHAASQRVMSTLNRHGFTNTAIIDEGILVWAQLGFPVRSGS